MCGVTQPQVNGIPQNSSRFLKLTIALWETIISENCETSCFHKGNFKTSLSGCAQRMQFSPASPVRMVVEVSPRNRNGGLLRDSAQ